MVASLRPSFQCSRLGGLKQLSNYKRIVDKGLETNPSFCSHRRGRFHLGTPRCGSEQACLAQIKTTSFYLVIPSLTGYPPTLPSFSSIPTFPPVSSFLRKQESILPCFPKMLGCDVLLKNFGLHPKGHNDVSPTTRLQREWERGINFFNSNKCTGCRSASPTGIVYNVVE